MSKKHHPTAARELVRQRLQAVHRNVSDKYLDLYAAELAWRDDHHGTDNGMLVEAVLKSAFAFTGPSSMRGYWQRHRRNKDDQPQGAGRSHAAVAKSGSLKQENGRRPVRSRGKADSRE